MYEVELVALLKIIYFKSIVYTNFNKTILKKYVSWHFKYVYILVKSMQSGEIVEKYVLCV